MLSLIIISGRSGSGKSTALHVLEDMGYYCIDNLPAGLLPPLVERITANRSSDKVAVSIDARNIASDLNQFAEIVDAIEADKARKQIVYLDAGDGILLQRFSETRRKHPLSSRERDLGEALAFERELLSPISGMADLTIDTTSLTIHELRDLIRSRVAQDTHSFALLFQSFAYKNGVPVDADVVFDVRCLPNPHWVPHLRSQTGLDDGVQSYLDSQAEFVEMREDISGWLDRWLPRFEANNRSYMTIAIGCTGGQHRSVYLAETLYEHCREHWTNVQVRHRELSRSGLH